MRRLDGQVFEGIQTFGYLGTLINSKIVKLMKQNQGLLQVIDVSIF
jgi:hypothetical protein